MLRKASCAGIGWEYVVCDGPLAVGHAGHYRDAGTGAAVLGRELVAAGGKLRGHILIGHTHWDHIQGFS